MDKRREALALLGGLVGVALLPACATGKRLEPHRYTESVSSILISKDSRYFVVISEKYHYIFGTTPDILAVLKEPFHQWIKASFGVLYIDGNNRASLAYSLKLDQQAPPDVQTKVRGMRFKGSSQLSFDGRLQGDRYDSNGIKAAHDNVRLNQTYEIKVLAENIEPVGIGRAVVTPIKMAGAGALVIAAMPLILIVSLFMNLPED